MDLSEKWKQLETQRIEQNETVNRLVDMPTLYRTYVGINGLSGKRVLSFEVPEGQSAKFRNFPDINGIQISIAATGQEQDGLVTLSLTAGSAAQNEEFAIIVSDIISALTGIRSGKEYAEAVRTRLIDWVHFFELKPAEALSRAAVIGLMGELFFIQDQFSNGISKADIWWNGPHKTAQDFQMKNLAVEVKTTTKNELSFVHISDISQLACPDGMPDAQLYLVAYRLIEDAAHGVNFPQLIAAVQEQIPEDRKGAFDMKLKYLGYDKQHDNEYVDRYTVAERRVYHVAENFPKLIRSNVPNEIENVRYVLNLNECGKFLSDFHTLVEQVKD